MSSCIRDAVSFSREFLRALLQRSQKLAAKREVPHARRPPLSRPNLQAAIRRRPRGQCHTGQRRQHSDAQPARQPVRRRRLSGQPETQGDPRRPRLPGPRRHPRTAGPRRHRHAGCHGAGPRQGLRRRGVPAAIVISAGFSELGAEGRALEQQIRSCSRQDAHHRAELPRRHSSAEQPQCQLRRRAWPGPAASPCSASRAPSARRSSTGPRQKHIGFSSFVSVGAMLDVDFADLMDYFADDPGTRSIILYMESIGDVRKFLSAARSVARTKQVIVVKSGRARGRSAGGGVAHRGAGGGRRRLRRRFPPRRHPARHHDPGPVRHVGDPGTRSRRRAVRRSPSSPTPAAPASWPSTR